MKQLTILLILLITGPFVRGQDSTQANITWSAFADLYYSYDFNKPDNHLKPGFLVCHNRHNEINLNLAFVKASYQSQQVRANVALMAGTYAQYNLAAEPELLRHVFEANAGLRLSKTRNLWLDAGILPSHIGYETAVTKDNWSLTRSLAAENSPYYEAGARVSYTSPSTKWYLAALLLNGWQRIQRRDGNNTPAFGTQLTFVPNKKATLNWSTFIGNDLPDNLRRWRYFNNFYAIWQLNAHFGITGGVDIGLQQAAKGSSTLQSWYAPSLVLRWTPNDRWAFAARGEYYADEKGVLIATNSQNGFKTVGGSLNLDRNISDHALWRIEARTLNSRDPIFVRDQMAVKGNTFVTTSVCVTL